MPSFLSRLFGKRRDPITIRARQVVISENVLNDDSRPINVEADEVLLLGNKIPAWYQRPVGLVVLTVIAGLILWGIVKLAETWLEATSL